MAFIYLYINILDYGFSLFICRIINSRIVSTNNGRFSTGRPERKGGTGSIRRNGNKAIQAF
jgi:hypothetical protein